MSQPGNFFGGFITGTIVGGVVGGIMGVLVSNRLAQANSEEAEQLPSRNGKVKKRLHKPTEQSIEVARRGLEDKIAQLNDAIDDVRGQLSSTNGNGMDREKGAIADNS
jgi:gas vesicle protein